MKGSLVVLTLLAVSPAPMGPDLVPESLPPKEAAITTAFDEAFEKLSLPCPERIHNNEGPLFCHEEGSRFGYRPHDLYADCADEMDALARTREPVDERLLQVGNKGKDLPERYRAVWILIQRRYEKVVPILKKMAASSDALERYLAWHAYNDAIRNCQLPAPQCSDGILAQFRKEKNRYVRARIMEFLGACKARDAVPLLTAALDEDTQYCAVEALGEIRDPKSVPVILARARKETLNRHIYYSVLGRIGTPEAVDYLLEHLGEGHFAVKALFESGSPKALPALEKYLERLKKTKEPDELNVATAHIGVLRLKNKDVRAQLIALAEDRKQSQWMRSGALEALGHYDLKPLAKRILQIYRTDKDDWMRMFYVRLLRGLEGKKITEAMIDQALTDNPDEYCHSQRDLLEALNQRLHTSFRTMPALVEYLQRQYAPSGR